MRFLYPIAASLIALASHQATAAPAPTAPKAKLLPGSECRDASRHFAREGSVWRKAPVKPRKLAELPPADAYAAVLRLDERGCLALVHYRDVGSPKPPKR